MRPHGTINLIGSSPSINELKKEIDRVARSDSKVLITGESGVGKEIVARAVGAASLRANAAFVPVNCAGIPETLLESELFGHVKGSFTGAYRDKPGKLEMADNGTIFLDEIGEMTLRMQGLLLRFLETGEIQKVGAERTVRTTNVRVMCATNRGLPTMISQGLFREDLFYRINVIHLIVPPLREPREDIPLLIDHFLAKFNAGAVAHANGNGHAPYHDRRISPDAMAVLCDYGWPGNVRQIENVIERLIVTKRSNDEVRVEDLPHEVRTPGTFGRPKHERRRTVADDLFKRLVDERQSFWSVVYPLYMNREITKTTVRELIHKGLAEARGNYKIVLRLFNMEPMDYKRFLNFLRKHDCQLPFKEYR